MDSSSAAADGSAGTLRRSGRERKQVIHNTGSDSSDYEDSGRDNNNASSGSEDEVAVPDPAAARRRGRPRKDAPAYRPTVSPAVMKSRLGPPRVIPPFVPNLAQIDLVPPPIEPNPLVLPDVASTAADYADRLPVAVRVAGSVSTVKFVTSAAYTAHRQKIQRLIAAALKSYTPTLVPAPELMSIAAIPTKRTVTTRVLRATLTPEQLKTVVVAPAAESAAAGTAESAAESKDNEGVDGDSEYVTVSSEELLDEDDVRAEETRVASHNLRQETLYASMVELERADHIAQLQARITEWLPEDFLPSDAADAAAADENAGPLGGRTEPQWRVFARERGTLEAMAAHAEYGVIAKDDPEWAVCTAASVDPAHVLASNEGEVLGRGAWPRDGMALPAQCSSGVAGRDASAECAAAIKSVAAAAAQADPIAAAARALAALPQLTDTAAAQAAVTAAKAHAPPVDDNNNETADTKTDGEEAKPAVAAVRASPATAIVDVISAGQLRTQEPWSFAALGIAQFTAFEYETLYKDPLGHWTLLETIALLEFATRHNLDSWPLTVHDRFLSVRHSPADCEARFATILALSAIYGRDLQSLLHRSSTGLSLDVPVILPPTPVCGRPRDYTDKYLKGNNRILVANNVAMGLSASGGPAVQSQSAAAAGYGAGGGAQHRNNSNTGAGGDGGRAADVRDQADVSVAWIRLPRDGRRGRASPGARPGAAGEAFRGKARPRHRRALRGQRKLRVERRHVYLAGVGLRGRNREACAGAGELCEGVSGGRSDFVSGGEISPSAEDFRRLRGHGKSRAGGDDRRGIRLG